MQFSYQCGAFYFDIETYILATLDSSSESKHKNIIWFKIGFYNKYAGNKSRWDWLSIKEFQFLGEYMKAHNVTHHTSV